MDHIPWFSLKISDLLVFIVLCVLVFGLDAFFVLDISIFGLDAFSAVVLDVLNATQIFDSSDIPLVVSLQINFQHTFS